MTYPKTCTVFLFQLLDGSSDIDDPKTLLLTDRKRAALARDRLATLLTSSNDIQVLVFDLAGVAFTPATLHELLVPLAQRIRGGEHGTVRLIISATDPAVRDSIRYLAQAQHLPLYLSPSPFDLPQATPVGDLTTTEIRTLDTILLLGGQVTASRLAATEGIKPSAATNRLVRLDRDGYLLRQPRGRRDGDVYIEPRSATSTPMDLRPYTVSTTGTATSKLVRSPLLMSV